MKCNLVTAKISYIARGRYACARARARARIYVDLYFLRLHGYKGKKVTRRQTVAEKDLSTRILSYLKTVPKCFAWKEHGGMYGTSGIPDIIACIDGRFYAFEVKTPEGRLSRLQDATIHKILACGGAASVVRSVGEVRAVINGSLQ